MTQNFQFCALAPGEYKIVLATHYKLCGALWSFSPHLNLAHMRRPNALWHHRRICPNTGAGYFFCCSFISSKTYRIE